MTDKEIKLSKDCEDFYPKNYQREKDASKSNEDSAKKVYHLKNIFQKIEY
jgi:hypothetical protein